jgi:hypothetical protein
VRRACRMRHARSYAESKTMPNRSSGIYVFWVSVFQDINYIRHSPQASEAAMKANPSSRFLLQPTSILPSCLFKGTPSLLRTGNILHSLH